jgi:hypothetical protein
VFHQSHFGRDRIYQTPSFFTKLCASAELVAAHALSSKEGTLSTKFVRSFHWPLAETISVTVGLIEKMRAVG